MAFATEKGGFLPLPLKRGEFFSHRKGGNQALAAEKRGNLMSVNH
jgi:hypothetical protein